MKKFISYLFGNVILGLLPGILLIQDSSLQKYIPLYLSLLFFFSTCTSWILSTRKLPLQSYTLRLLVICPLYSPLSLLAAYPFSTTNVFLLLLVTSVGILLPWVSRYLTWWCYTLGGIVPLPTEHHWLLEKTNTAKEKGSSYKQFLKKSGGIGVGIGLIVLFYLSHGPIWNALLFLKLCSLIVIFGLGLSVGTGWRRKLSH